MMMLLDIKCFLDGQASGYHLKNKIFRTKPVGQDQNKLKENNSYNISFFFFVVTRICSMSISLIKFEFTSKSFTYSYLSLTKFEFAPASTRAMCSITKTTLYLKGLEPKT